MKNLYEIAIAFLAVSQIRSTCLFVLPDFLVTVLKLDGDHFFFKLILEIAECK